MKRNIISKISACIAVLICFTVVLNSAVTAAEISSDLLNVDSIEIIERHGIVEGSSVQLTAEIMPKNTVASAVEWSSSNPSVISCTKEGRITGVSAGGYADITCKAKFGSVKDKIRIYCVESIGSTFKSGFVDYVTFVYAKPSVSKVVAWNVDFFVIYDGCSEHSCSCI